MGWDQATHLSWRWYPVCLEGAGWGWVRAWKRGCQGRGIGYCKLGLGPV